MAGTDLAVRRRHDATDAADPVAAAIADLRAGRMVVVIDDRAPDGTGSLLLAAVHAGGAQIAFMIRHTDGILQVAMPASELDRLHLSAVGGAMSVDARSGIGVSASDRAQTIALLVDIETRPHDLRSPGHVFPVQAADGGVLRRAGRTEAAVDLARLAGLRPVGVIGDVIDDDGSPADERALHSFAAIHGLTVVSTTSLVAHRYRTERTVELLAETRLPTEHGDFRALGFRSTIDGLDHIALVAGDLGTASSVPALVRIQSECLIGNTFQAWSCDCGPQLHWAMRKTVSQRAGVVVYLRGKPAAGTELGVGAQILRALNLDRVRLLTNDPGDRVTLQQYGVDVVASVRMPAQRRTRCPLS